MRSSILAVGVALGAGLGVFASPTPPPESGFDERSEMRDVFKKLKASANTDWQPCHYWFQCMVLRMPLDHDDSSLGTVAIGFVKSPADEKSKDPQDILFNPGGPGASGIEVMVDGIDAIRQRLGWEHNIESSAIDVLKLRPDEIRPPEWLAQSKGEDPSTSQLWYYGASYGPILGAAFADRCPRRVGRLILDSVPDAEAYFSGDWTANIVDADRDLEEFFSLCQEAGPSSCKFWDHSVSRIKQRFNAINAKLATWTTHIENGGYFFNSRDFRQSVSKAIHDPKNYFSTLASFLADLERAIQRGFRERDEIESLDELNPRGLLYDGLDFEARFFIACTDADGRHNLSSFNDFIIHVNTEYNTSRYMGEGLASAAAMCRHMSIRAPRSQVVYPERLGVNTTANPILFLSISIDPVTPIQGARKMTKKFRGSRLLEQQGIGHTTFSGDSPCTEDVVQRYLKNASLPPEVFICRGDGNPFRWSGVRRTTLVGFPGVSFV
ncbi:hypothetical protein PMIN01_10337 [Paraphaeosphaeria minitans]|uniref:Peptidase S33 tripeptidyl aminopeptidase-like C-terminal domain-containing protein n=1 Tax=Paraphaeosphaeria minitans TaxID=565426 RepID=A0A9P6KLX3_9PLEO|nr:hypothetical protein PMIN01_10337 [Paraphaeosphaeria minitans]